MPILCLDAEAVSALSRSQQKRRAVVVRDALEAARRLGREVVTPAVILAELYRGHGHDQIVDALLSRESAIHVRDTDRSFARYVGAVLTASGRGSRDIADAHSVAAVVEAGGGVVLTGDKSDVEALAAAFRTVHVQTI